MLGKADEVEDDVGGRTEEVSDVVVGNRGLSEVRDEHAKLVSINADSEIAEDAGDVVGTRFRASVGVGSVGRAAAFRERKERTRVSAARLLAEGVSKAGGTAGCYASLLGKPFRCAKFAPERGSSQDGRRFRRGWRR